MRRPDPYPPLDVRATAWRLAGGGFILILALWAIGVPLVHAQALLGVRLEDAQASLLMLGMRTTTLNDLSHIGSSLSDTAVAIIVLCVAVTVFRLWLGRWRESIVVFVSIGGELLFFLAVTGVIARDRPIIEHLDPAPPTSSFPSGHVAAAVALYGCISVILVRNLRPGWVAVLLAIVLWTIPMAVGVSRLYRGMHHLSDVVVGATAGGVWLMFVIATLYPLPPPTTSGTVDSARELERDSS